MEHSRGTQHIDGQSLVEFDQADIIKQVGL
jgi:hypothetical protein